MPIITSSGMPAAVAEVVGLDCLGLPKTRRTTAAAGDARCAALQVPLDLLRPVCELAWWGQRSWFVVTIPGPGWIRAQSTAPDSPVLPDAGAAVAASLGARCAVLHAVSRRSRCSSRAPLPPPRWESWHLRARGSTPPTPASARAAPPCIRAPPARAYASAHEGRSVRRRAGGDLPPRRRGARRPVASPPPRGAADDTEADAARASQRASLLPASRTRCSPNVCLRSRAPAAARALPRRVDFHAARISPPHLRACTVLGRVRPRHADRLRAPPARPPPLRACRRHHPPALANRSTFCSMFPSSPSHPLAPLTSPLTPTPRPPPAPPALAATADACMPDAKRVARTADDGARVTGQSFEKKCVEIKIQRSAASVSSLLCSRAAVEVPRGGARAHA